MVDSALVLKGQTIAYTCYTIVIMLVSMVRPQNHQEREKQGTSCAFLHLCGISDSARSFIAHYYLQHHSLVGNGSETF